jgi:hypothetical protein
MYSQYIYSVLNCHNVAKYTEFWFYSCQGTDAAYIGLAYDRRQTKLLAKGRQSCTCAYIKHQTMPTYGILEEMSHYS